jgi:hypothetical protein
VQRPWIDLDLGRHVRRVERSRSFVLRVGCCMSSFDAMPKYIRALIFGASRCGLSGFR